MQKKQTQKEKKNKILKWKVLLNDKQKESTKENVSHKHILELSRHIDHAELHFPAELIYDKSHGL